jgi:hypothetical protein
MKLKEEEEERIVGLTKITINARRRRNEDDSTKFVLFHVFPC